MSDSFTKRVAAAAAAGWGAVVIMWVLMTFSWGIYLLVVHARPAWVLTLVGGREMDWGTYQNLALGMFGALKVGLLLILAVVIWLTLWARRLRRAD